MSTVLYGGRAAAVVDIRLHRHPHFLLLPILWVGIQRTDLALARI